MRCLRIEGNKERRQAADIVHQKNDIILNWVVHTVKRCTSFTQCELYNHNFALRSLRFQIMLIHLEKLQPRCCGSKHFTGTGRHFHSKRGTKNRTVRIFSVKKMLLLYSRPALAGVSVKHSRVWRLTTMQSHTLRVTL